MAVRNPHARHRRRGHDADPVAGQQDGQRHAAAHSGRVDKDAYVGEIRRNWQCVSGKLTSPTEDRLR
jgi:hypothetical protein